MLNLGLDLIECFKIHYCAKPKQGTQAFVEPFSVKSKHMEVLNQTGHTHSFYHYIYVLAAKGARLQIGNDRYILYPGCAYMVKPNVLHNIVLNEDYELVMYEIKFSSSHSELASLLESLPHILTDKDGQIRQVVRALTAEYSNAVFQDVLPYIKLYELLLVLSRIAQSDGPFPLPEAKPFNLEKSRFAPLLAYITQNFSKKITADQMAGIMRMEKGYFFKQFKKQFSITPMNYLQAVRISRSLNLIEYTDLSVAQIAEAVGFSDHHSFIKNFKAQYAMTPGEYRRVFQKNMQQKYGSSAT